MQVGDMQIDFILLSITILMHLEFFPAQILQLTIKFHLIIQVILLMQLIFRQFLPVRRRVTLRQMVCPS